MYFILGVKDMNKKKVIFILIDSFKPNVLASCLKQGSIPGLSFLIKKGILKNNCVSVFPTMTPCAISSITTGVFPGQHQIPGFVWYNRREKRIVNYGASPRAIWKIGFFQVIKDLLINLNKKQLSKKVKTIYELLEEYGISTSAVNFYIFRGKHIFKTKLPFLMRLLTFFKLRDKIIGPKSFFLGDIIPYPNFIVKSKFRMPTGLFNRFGINDEYSGTVANRLIIEGKQPDLMLVYLPDTDAYCHRHNPDKSHSSIIGADKQVQKILDAYDSWEEAIEKNVFIICGDHAQSRVDNKSSAIIDIDKLLSDFKLANISRKRVINKEAALCGNERMMHIYILKRKQVIQKIFLERLTKDERIDHIIWREWEENKPIYKVQRGGKEGILSFTRNGPFVDDYMQDWWVEGDLGILDIKNSNNKLTFDNYPDAFNRIASAFDAYSGSDIMLTAKIGYEFGGDEAPIHPGFGSHGSMHKLDSVVPLIISGSEYYLEKPRIVDIVPFILNHFNVPLPNYIKRDIFINKISIKESNISSDD